jgi:hypothetical protein
MSSILRVDDLQDSGGNSILSSNGSGTFTSNLPSSAVNTPSFFATASANQTSLSSGSFTKIQYNTELFDTDGKYDTSNYRFTPGTIGKYYIGASGGGAVNDGDRVALIIYKNGSSYLREQVGNSNPNGDFFSVHGIAEVTATTDYFEAYWYNGSSQAKNLSAGSSVSRFFGYKLIT